MIFDNFIIHMGCLLFSYNASFLLGIFLSQSLQKKEKNKIVYLAFFLVTSSFMTSYFIVKPINEVRTRIVKNKQFMILDNDGICESIMIPQKGKIYKFDCSILKGLDNTK